MRVAVASSDGKTINQHFGKATRFLVYEVTAAGHYYIETRDNIPTCGNNAPDDRHSESAVDRTIRLIGDCDAVLCSRIGNEAADRLREERIKPLEAPLSIDLAMEKFSRILLVRRRA